MGYRRRPYKGNGKLSDNKIAWTSTVVATVEVRQFSTEQENEESPDDVQTGPNIRLGIHSPGMRSPVSMSLTSCTEQELDALKAVIDLAFHLARPVAQQRDEEAAHAKSQGDDSLGRIYRAVPHCIVRPGKITPYYEGVLYGPEGLHEGPWDRYAREPGGGVRGAGGGVADEVSEDASPEDDGAEADES